MNGEQRLAMRAAVRAIFDHALSDCNVSAAFQRRIHFQEGVLHAGSAVYEVARFSRIALVSIGKAGHSMAEALTEIMPIRMEGIVSCPVLPEHAVPGLRYFAGGHPMPNEASLLAGRAILDLLREMPTDGLAIFCISGGASALAEWPLDESLTLAEMVAVNRALVHSGAHIAEINAVRKHLSAIKGGRMAHAAAPATQLSLLVSDVPDGAIDALASGPTMPDSTTVDDCYAIAQRYGIAEEFPTAVRKAFEEQRLQETPKAGDAAFAKSHFETLLSNSTAVSAAIERAAELGFEVAVDNRCDDWDYARAADYLLGRLSEVRRRSQRACVISGGEVTVRVGEKSGVGGRNQQFALSCAQKIAGQSIIVLSAGTDGIDGNSQAAGALVDGTTEARAAEAGESIDEALLDFDAYRVLDAIGDTVMTGPTGNNVRDLRILLSY